MYSVTMSKSMGRCLVCSFSPISLCKSNVGLQVYTHQIQPGYMGIQSSGKAIRSHPLLAASR